MFPSDDPSIPLLPPAQVRILDLHAEPWPDGRRVRVHLQLTPFAEKPNIDLNITTSSGQPVAGASIIENLVPKLVLTMHLRDTDPQGRYNLLAVISYPDADPVDSRTVPFTVLPADA